MTAAGIARRFIERTVATEATESARPWVLFIDGRSGSGKTTLSARVVKELHKLSGSAPQTLAMDELYPGWHGLAEGSASLARVLSTLRYRRYDWGTGHYGNQVALDQARTLVVEGCGSITSHNFEAASRSSGSSWNGFYGVWVACPDEIRRTRALARDGDMFAPHWDSWAAQERVHFSKAQPIALAHEIMHVA